jgi:hypothetical protein
MTNAKGFQSHMDQHETVGEVVKSFIAVVVAALMGWFGSSLTKVSRKDFDKLADEFAALKTQYSTNAAASNAELTAIKVTLVAMQRQMDESFRLVREDLHRNREREHNQ